MLTTVIHPNLQLKRWSIMTEQNQTPDAIAEDTVDDVEGHGSRPRDDDDVEGHGSRPRDDDDVEGHGSRPRDDDDDVEGHGARARDDN
jgi:hypothetical protein